MWKKVAEEEKTDYENRCKGNVGATLPVCIYSVIFFPKGLHEVTRSLVLYVVWFVMLPIQFGP